MLLLDTWDHPRCSIFLLYLCVTPPPPPPTHTTLNATSCLVFICFQKPTPAAIFQDTAPKLLEPALTTTQGWRYLGVYMSFEWRRRKRNLPTAEGSRIMKACSLISPWATLSMAYSPEVCGIRVEWPSTGRSLPWLSLPPCPASPASLVFHLWALRS